MVAATGAPGTADLTARAVLFDMDGTLVDSTAVVEQVWRAFASENGMDAQAIIATGHGVRAEDTMRRHGPVGFDVATGADRLFDLELAAVDGIVPVPGARAFVESLPTASIALVTSARRALALRRLEIADVPTPGVVVTAADVEHGKPAPDCYLLAARLLGVDPADAIVFEDAEAGIAAGLAAGMRTVVVGSHESETTRGLPRIRDYRDVSVTLHEAASAGQDPRPSFTIALPL
ncbi:HAD-IA family hydrolase [Agreia pratensis]|uniref:HAD-IA family hydrolase n=1 Tax=Agreia pratensis TaxID=150121 RepID=UPI00188C6D18|nr:HAD-IA family hydrolase [Agreia pratensis]MBF4633067.1 HAD-IA family hydrolase [Agreia pratensis]